MSVYRQGRMKQRTFLQDLIQSSSLFSQHSSEASLAVIEAAENWVGYLAGPNSRTPFGERSGYDGNIWAGAFIDFVFHSCAVTIPSCVYTPSGLAEFNKAQRVHLKPQPGDIVFFTFPTASDFGAGHVGLVTDISRWTATGLVGTVEGQVNSGLPKGDTAARGVYRRVRSEHEIIGFARPEFRPGAIKATTGQRVTILLSSIRPGKRNKDIGHVQLALEQVTGLRNITTDMFDGPTKQAYARWQRIIGYVGERANGVPDQASLELLGSTTGHFLVEVKNPA